MILRKCIPLLLGVLLAGLLPPALAAETVKPVVTGTVVDRQGVPVVGAAVMVKDNTSLGGAVTDFEGNFSISVPKGSVLTVSCIGFITAERIIDGDCTWSVVLLEDAQLLDDVVVIGYGVQKKESVVGAISQVNSEALVNSGTTNITNSIAGKLSGVQTYQTSGQPGADDATIYIRGMSSWNGSSPLVMVDGVERSFSDLDPNEVETISVLKDASATAVFGAKGANGVILVTTKSGSKGAPKMKLSVDYGVSTPMFVPEHVSSARIAEMANVAYRNEQSFASMFSQAEIDAYANRSNSVRYPDTDWYDLMMKDFSSSVNANFNVSGGTDKVKYFVSVGYTHEGSIMKEVAENTKFSYDKFNYRSNIDVKVTPTTTLSLKAGGSTGIEQHPSKVSVASLFTAMYSAPTAKFPAYYPSWTLEYWPDTDYPDELGDRIASNSGSYGVNPYTYLMLGDFDQNTVSKLNTDLILKQDLGFITEGLSAGGKASFTTSFTRQTLSGTQSNPTYDIDWNLVDAGSGNPWVSNNKNSEIYVQDPYAQSAELKISSATAIFYWEASLNYARKFASAHNVGAMLLMNQRQYIAMTSSTADYPGRSQAFVGRMTYDYKGRYLLEANMGYTGSDQFAPKNRYGFFPSVAAGYVLSKEPFWKRAMPWWSTMKIRYSDGLVGSDSSSSKWLYYSTYEKTSTGTIIESAAANTSARWETARKRDLGFEMGWLDNDIVLNVDLFDEHRKDMLVQPVVTPMVAVGYKDVNAGEMKKHGIDIELKYRHTTASGLYYELGGMLGLNENRIINYEDAPYVPGYQKSEGKPYGAQKDGVSTVDNGYFNTIDEIHGYPTYTGNWSSVYTGLYKYLDYKVDGAINSDDLHVVKGTIYPPCVYSFNLGLSYKGLSFNVLFYGNYGKYVNFNKSFMKEFIKKDLTVHTAQLDYWRPDHRDASHPNLTFDDSMYRWAGGGGSEGYSIRMEGQTWRQADYLSVKEAYLSYRFDSDKVKKALGVSALSVTLTGNNLFTFTNLIEGNPQSTSVGSTTYPLMRVVKLGAKLEF